MRTFFNSPRRLSTLGVAAVVFLVGALAACSGAATGTETTSSEPTIVEVTGTADETPKLSYARPFVFGESRSEILWEGSGDTIRDDEWVLLKFFAEDPATGDVIRNDYLESPLALRMNAKTLGAELYTLLVNKPAGTRAMQITQEGDQTNIVVVDMLPAVATGEPRPQSDEYPAVQYDELGQPLVTIEKGVKRPKQLVVQQLRGGGIRQVENGAQVVLQYVGVKWKGAEVFDSTWTSKQGPVTVQLGSEQIITGLEQALVGAPVGSQLLVIVPPDLGFADSGHELAKSTLVYVVDVLAASDARQ